MEWDASSAARAASKAPDSHAAGGSCAGQWTRFHHHRKFSWTGRLDVCLRWQLRTIRGPWVGPILLQFDPKNFKSRKNTSLLSSFKILVYSLRASRNALAGRVNEWFQVCITHLQRVSLHLYQNSVLCWADNSILKMKKPRIVWFGQHQISKIKRWP